MNAEGRAETSAEELALACEELSASDQLLQLKDEINAARAFVSRVIADLGAARCCRMRASSRLL